MSYADAQATLYRSGHFLTSHNDDTPGSKRLAAYVLSFTPAWRAEWGGLLEFLDGNGQVETGYLPGFNTLKLFRVPMTHYVSMVAALCLRREALFGHRLKPSGTLIEFFIGLTASLLEAECF